MGGKSGLLVLSLLITNLITLSYFILRPDPNYEFLPTGERVALAGDQEWELIRSPSRSSFSALIPPGTHQSSFEWTLLNNTGVPVIATVNDGLFGVVMCPGSERKTLGIKPENDAFIVKAEALSAREISGECSKIDGVYVSDFVSSTIISCKVHSLRELGDKPLIPIEAKNECP